jgi:Rrf2 family protein
MRLSGKTIIAIRALYDMAFHCRGRQAQAKEIARRQRIPIRTLEEVLQDLRKAGLIDAQRGPRGGYVLSRPAEEIAVLQIIRALEGPVQRRYSLDFEERATDVPALIWKDITGRIAAILGQTTLGDFVARAENAGVKRVISEPQMYFI